MKAEYFSTDIQEFIIEHNLDVIKTADWVIELGPEADSEGGYIVAQGAPEENQFQAILQIFLKPVGKRILLII